MKKTGLDKEEKEILDSIEKGEWVSVDNLKNEIKRYAKYAKNTLKKDKRISIRISSQDYLDIQAKAVEEGMPYQTLITSMVHKYAKGKLVPKS